MSAEDLIIWRRWYPSVRADARRLWFNVRLGEGAEISRELPQPWQDFWLGETQKRADVVIETLTELWLIELRHQASANAVGRLLLYQNLYVEDPLSASPLILWLVTDQRDRDVARLTTQLNIRYVVI